MFPIKSLREKTLLWALIPTAIVMVAAGIIALYAYEQVARDVIQERDAELARISAARLSEGLSQYSRVLQSTAANDDIQSMEPARLSSALEEAQNQLYVFDAGVVVYDSEGVALWSQPFVAERQGTDHPVTSELDKVRSTRQPAFSNVFQDEISGEDVVLVGVPILGSGGEFKGVLAGMFEMKYPLLGAIYAEVLQLKVGKSGYAYLVDGNGQVIYHPDGAQMGANLADTEPVMQATRGESGAVLTEDSTGESVIAGFAPVPGTGWGLITQERWGAVVGPIRGYSQLLLGLLVVGGLISGTLIFFAIGRILKPIKDLTQGAQRIAGGDFDYTITAKTGDEIQDLAQQFDTMAGALKESYSNLEQKVEERTRAERRRAEQLRAINEVGRKISSILSLDELLPYVADLLRDSFNYYNINIFLLDPESEQLVLRAGAGGYKGAVPIGSTVKVSEGIVGWVVQTGEPLLANDVAKEPKYLFVEELADTRSELAVPIKLGAETLGVLDLESAELDAFDETDLSTAQTLSDQVAIAIENARLYQETRQMAVIEERNRMAREIHDTLAQGFTGIVLQLEAAEQALGEDLGAMQQHLDRARSLARENLNEARRSVWGLRPGALEQLPLVGALAQEIERFTRQSGVKANFNISEGSCRLPEDVEAALLRICQESLANVRKHAQASEVDVNLNFEESAVRLSIRDNGVGFDPQTLPEGTFGLIGMRERARLLGGEFAVQSEKGKGVLIQATIPIRKGERGGAY